MSPELPDISRAEYEQFIKVYEVRHTELRLEMKELETDIKADISSMSIKIDRMSLEMAHRGLDAWKLVGTSAVSLIGGYVLAVLQHALIH